MPYLAVAPSALEQLDSAMLISMLVGLGLLVLIVLSSIRGYRSTHIKEQGPDGRYRWRRLRLGEGGELHVNQILSSLGPEYTVLYDVVLMGGYGTVQIDHVVVSRFGIFCIETKTYSGAIYGSERSEYWTQYVGHEQHSLRNPIRQNYGHLKTLESLFDGLPRVPVIPIVVFAGSAELKLTLENSLVVYSSQLASTIRSHSVGYVPQESVSEYVERIRRAMSLVTQEQKDSHVAQVRSEIFNKEFQLSAGYCPRCGRQLVLRQSPCGPFWGCQGYPTCRFTAQYDPRNPSVPKLS